MVERPEPLLRTLRLYKTPRNAVVLPIHYSHDPAKTEEWAAHQRANYPRPEDWDREMEIDFSLAMGALAYPAFRPSIHVFDDDAIAYYDRIPLALWCDFNTSPMSWGVSQIVGGWEHVLDEIYRDPSTIEEAVTEFRNLYPNHRAQVDIYGDATVKGFYETIKLHMRGYPAPVVMKVPDANPKVKDRVNAVNNRLAAKDGAPGVRIRRRCVQLLADLSEVVWRENQRDLLKISDPKNPYSKRTHMSDAWGYRICREWSSGVVQMVKPAARPPRKAPERVLGDVFYKNEPKGKR